MLDNPFIDCLGHGQGIFDTTHRPLRGAQDDAVGRHLFSRFQAAAQDFGALGNIIASGDVKVPVLGGDLATDLELQVLAALGPFGKKDFHVGYRVAVNSGAPEVALPIVAERACPRGVAVLHQWQPEPCRAVGWCQGER